MNERCFFRWLLIALAILLAGHFVADLAGRDPEQAQAGLGRTTQTLPQAATEVASGSLHAGVTMPAGPALAAPIGLSFALVAIAFARTSFRLLPLPEPPRAA